MTSHYLNQGWWVYRRIYASLGLIELTAKDQLFRYEQPTWPWPWPLTCKWCPTHHPFIGCIRATYQTNWKQIGRIYMEPHSWHVNNFEPSVWPRLWSFDLEMVHDIVSTHRLYLWHHTKRIGKLGFKPWGGNGKNFERAMWPWHVTFCPGSGVRHIVPSWIYSSQIWSESIR